MLRHVALIRTDVSEERIASIIRLRRIGELGVTLALISDGFFQEPHGATLQMTAFFNSLPWKPQVLHNINRQGSVAEM
jgi:hypothetical protein